MAIGIEQGYKAITNLIHKDHTKDYRAKIHDIITSRDKTLFPRTFFPIVKNNDLELSVNGKLISIRNFLKEIYDVDRDIEAGGQFLNNTKGSNIYYQAECINNIGFRFAVFHEGAHAKNHRIEQRNKEIFTPDSAAFYNEKKARIDGYTMTKAFQGIYDTNVLEEFKSTTSICAYANMHLFLSLKPGLPMKDVNKLIIREDQFV